jgi:hypothetical protein
MTDQRVDKIVKIEQAITEQIADLNDSDPSNVEPGSWTMISAIASTLADDNWPERHGINNALDMLVATQEMLAEELVGMTREWMKEKGLIQ